MRSLPKIALSGALLLCLGLSQLLPARALVKMDDETIRAALVYGMQNSKLGISTLLGPNWIEGPNGALLNIYSPFMTLASKAARGGFPKNPKEADVAAAKKKYGKYVAYYKDPKNRLQVKFAVNFYGDSPDFANKYRGRIEGFGRGKEFVVSPVKFTPDKIADPVVIQDKTLYEATNGYYFLFKDIEDLQDYKLILEAPGLETITFRIRNERIY